MNYEQFKKLLTASKRKMTIVSIVITLMGAGLLAGIVLDGNKTAYWIIGGLLLLLGIPLSIVSIKGLSQMNSGKFPLLKAIREKETDYVIWIYENEIVQKVEGVQAGKSSNIVIYQKDGKQQQIVLGRKVPAGEVIAYLSAAFPAAHVGYADATREAVGRLLKKKV